MMLGDAIADADGKMAYFAFTLAAPEEG